MKQSCYSLLLFLWSLLLLGCAHYHHNQQEQMLANAKANFISQDYTAAFKQLRPLARQGNAEAQYALGYLYFYGQGHTKNTEQAIFWITQSAAQHYLPATQALNLMTKQYHQTHDNFTSQKKIATITQKTMVAAPLPTHIRPIHFKESKTSFTTVAHPRSSVSPTTTPMPTANSHVKPSATFTLQLFASQHPASVHSFIKNHKLNQTIHYGVTQAKQQTWYVATLGQFNSKNQARKAIAALPKEIQNLKPWIRRTTTLAVIPQTTLTHATRVADIKAPPVNKHLDTQDSALLDTRDDDSQYHGWMRVI